MDPIVEAMTQINAGMRETQEAIRAATTEIIRLQNLARSLGAEDCIKCGVLGKHQHDEFDEPLCKDCRENREEAAWQRQQEEGLRGGEALALHLEQQAAARRLK